MKTGTVKVSEEFIKADGTKKWFGHEKQYDQDTEDPLDVYAKAESEMNTYVKKSNQVMADNLDPYGANLKWAQPSTPPGPPPVITIERTSEDKRIAELIRDIYACTQLDGDNGLWTYSKLASTSNEVQNIYAIMEKKLREKEVTQILDATNEHYKNAPRSKK